MYVRAALLAAGLAATTLAAQTQPQVQPPIFRAGVDVVQLEVSVLDQNRKPVRGLTTKDFAVFENGDAQVVVDVQEFVLDSRAPEPVWARAVSADVTTNSLTDRRLIAIVMDDRRCCWAATPLPNGDRLSDPAAIRTAIDTARYLVGNLGPRDMATVALTRDAIPVLPFTSDRDDLYAAIARFSPMSEGGCIPLTPDRTLADLTRLLQMSNVPLKTVVHLMSPIPPGRRRMVPAKCPRPSYRIPGTGQVVTGAPPRQGGPEPDPLELPTVPMYTLNVSGLFVDMSLVEKKQLPMPLKFMNGPNESGGWNYYRNNDLSPAVHAVLEESDSYYLVGFRTLRPTLDGAYRRLEVKVTRAGDGAYEVRARSGYRRPKPAPAPGSRAARNPEVPVPPTGVSGLLPKSAVTLDAAVAAFPLDAQRATVLVNVDLTHPVGDTVMTQPEQLEVRAVAYRAGSTLRDVRTTLRIDPVAGMSRIRASVPVKLELAPDRYELWISARDLRTLRMGDVTLRFEVPDFATRTVAVSGIVLGSEPGDGSALHPALSGLVPIVPTTARVFGGASEITAYFQIHQGGKSPVGAVSLRMRILDEQGNVRLDRLETLEPGLFSASRTAPYALRLPLDTLSPGRHLLSVEARLGDRIAAPRDVPFEVR